MSRRVKFTWDESKTENKFHKFCDEIYKLVESRCERDCDGSLPVQFMMRSKSLHYPFNDCFLISNSDKDIDRAIELQMTNLSCAMDRLKILYRIKSMIVKKS